MIEIHSKRPKLTANLNMERNKRDQTVVFNDPNNRLIQLLVLWEKSICFILHRTHNHSFVESAIFSGVMLGFTMPLTRDVPNVHFVFASVLHSGTNSLFVFSQTVAPSLSTNSSYANSSIGILQKPANHMVQNEWNLAHQKQAYTSKPKNTTMQKNIADFAPVHNPRNVLADLYC